MSGQVPTLHSRQVNLGNVQEVSGQIGECQRVDSIMLEANEYDAITEEWDKYDAITEVLDQLLGVQLVRGQRATRNISFVSC